MHREISHADGLFAPPRHAPLYLLTVALAGLLAVDLWGLLAGWLAGQGVAGLWRPPERLFGRETPFALLAAVLGTARVLYSALESLADGRTGADLALAVAAFAAILIGQPLVAAEVVVIGLVGESLEAFTFARTQAAVRRLGELFPRRCWRLRDDGTEERVLTSELRPGDRVVVKPGAKVPADGVVAAGRSAVDASALTGEALPLDKGPGDAVLAGSVNQFGALTVTCQRVGDQTVAGRVIELTARALKDKSPLERRADRLARYFLPVVLGVAAATFLAHVALALPRVAPAVAAYRAAFPALAVLVVACPCALILATPAAVMAAVGRLAGTGVLLKSGAALERLAGVTAFAFDKTGTLTEGRPEPGDVVAFGPATETDVLLAAAAAERPSEHPLARVVLKAAADRGLSPPEADDFRALPGAGVLARVGGDTVVVGTPRLLAEQGVAVPPEAADALERLDAAGQTGLLVARGGTVIGAVGARDRVRPEADAVLRELRALGIGGITILTGDREAAARAVAGQLGVADVRAGLLPQEKAAHLGERAAFVGDGVNDAPALARAAVGVAVAGTDLAAEAGDVVLAGEPLRPLPFLVRLSRETVRVIEQNIVVFAFGLNAAGVVLTGWLWPLLGSSDRWHESAPLAAAAYHQLASLAVLLNAMRLLAFERPAAVALWGRLRAAGRAVDHGIDTVANVDEWLHGLAHHARAVAAAAGVLLLVAWAASGFVAVQPGERAVVRRFGRPLAETLGPGLHWRWPWPVERADRVDTARVRTVEVGFRPSASAAPGPAADGALTWASGHGDGIDRVSDESEMMTGDGSLVELLASVRYRVTDPVRFALEVGDAEALLRSAAESALREAVAGEPFLELLTTRRPALAALAKAGLERRLAAAGGVGVEVEGVSLHDLHPPAEVVRAFHDVARAMEERDRRVNEAHAEALRRTRRAAGEALHTARQGEAAAARTLADARATRDGFLAWLSARGDGDARGLTEFRLAWEALARALAGRDKVILDADKLPGRRQLWLIDPDVLRPPPAGAPPRPRDGPP